MNAFEQLGAMTANIAIGLANEQFGLDIPSIEEPWGDYPFAVVKALAAQGKIKGDIEGFDDMLKEAEEVPAAFGGPGAEGDPDEGVDPEAANDDPEAEDGLEEEAQRQIRRAIGNLRDVLETARKAAYEPYVPNPPRRQRGLGSKRTPRTDPPRPPINHHVTSDKEPPKPGSEALSFP